jgi:hypothetical protein
LLQELTIAISPGKTVRIRITVVSQGTIGTLLDLHTVTIEIKITTGGTATA